MAWFLILILLWTPFKEIYGQGTKLGVIISDRDGNANDMVTSVFNQVTKALSTPNITLHVVQPTVTFSNVLAILDQVCSTTSDLSVAVTQLPCYEDKVVTGFLASSFVPHVSLTSSCLGSQSPWTSQIQPQKKFVFNALYDIIAHEKIKTFILIHDDSTGDHALNLFTRKFSNSTTAASLLDINKFSSKPLWQHLTQLSYSQEISPVIVLLLDCLNTIKTLSMAEKLQMTETKLRWIVANDEVLLEDYKIDVWKSGNMVFVQNHYTPRKINPCNSVVLNNTVSVVANKTVRLLEQHYLTDAILLVVEALDDLMSREPGIITSKNLSCWSTPGEMFARPGEAADDPLVKAIERRIYGTDGHSSHIEYVVQGIDSNWLNGQMHVVTTATWTPSARLELSREEIFTTSYNNFEGLPLKVLISNFKPYAYYCDESKSGTDYDVLCGLCINILNEMARLLNFTIDAYVHKGPTGGMDKNGNWNGMVGKILKGDVDLAVGPTSITFDRAAAVDFTTSYIEDPAGIMLRKDRPRSVLRIFQPFPVEIWISFIVAIFLLPILLWFVERNSPLKGGGIYSEDRRPPQSLNDVMWQCFTTYFLQGGDYHHRSLSGRSLVVFWVLFSIIINSIYTAIWTAILTVSTEYAPISNLDDLAESSRYTPMILEGSNLQAMFKNADPGSVYSKVWAKMKDSTFPSSFNDAVDRMRQDENLAFMSDKTVLQYLLTNPKYCHEFVLAAESFNPTGLAFMVPKGAPYVTQLSKIIKHLQEGGFIKKWMDKFWQVNPECIASNASTTDTADMSSLLGIFIVMFAGLGVAILVLVIEKYFSKTSLSLGDLSSQWAKRIGSFGKTRNNFGSSIDGHNHSSEVTLPDNNRSQFNFGSVRSRKAMNTNYTTHM